MKAFTMLRTRWFRLGSRFFLCLLSFVAGCTLTVTFTNTLEGSRLELNPSLITEKFSRPNTREKVISKTLVVLILSAPENVQRRHAQRRTWLTLSDQDFIKYYFVVGSKELDNDLERKLHTEAEQYSDLLVLPEVQEGYNRLTRKLISSFLWVYKNVDFDFLLKVDDDSFVDIRQLFQELRRKTDSKRLYWGYFSGHAQVQRKGKWKELNWNLCDHYLPYARGGGYILARQLVQFLAQSAELLNIYKNEDVSVGAWLAPLNVTHVHDVRFDTEWSSRGCSNQHLITHPVSPSDMHKLHESMTNTGRACQEELKKRPSYVYDWSVLPSQCCKNNL